MAMHKPRFLPVFGLKTSKRHEEMAKKLKSCLPFDNLSKILSD
jgi:hypothetical protein